MKKPLSLIVFMTLSASAMSQQVLSDIRDEYRTVTVRVPHSTEICEDVRVRPHSSGRHDSSGGVVAGAIIGNIIGAATGLDGARTIGTIVGGLAGGNHSQDQQAHNDYIIENRCRRVINYSYETRQEYSHSIITFYADGKSYSLRFRK